MEAKAKGLTLQEAVQYLNLLGNKRNTSSAGKRFKSLRKAGKDKLTQNILTKEKFMSPWPCWGS